MCDCISLCLCLLSGAAISYYACDGCNGSKRLENSNTEPK